MKRAALVAAANALIGKPYVWGAKGPDEFDCSGVPTFCIHQLGGPDWRATHRAQTIADELPNQVQLPKEGDLAFYGPSWDHVVHVMVHRGDGTLVGACGGNRDVTSASIAQDRRAEVKVRFKAAYRPDLLGFRSIAALVEDP